MIDTRAIRMRWEADGSKRDERGQRLFAASEARAAGWGGVAAVAKITGVSRKRITAGLKDLAAPPLDPGRVRRKGGGRRPITETAFTRDSGDLCHRRDASPTRGPRLARREQALPTLVPLRAVRLPPHANRPSVDHATRLANTRSPGNPPESIRRTRLHAQLDSLIFARRLSRKLSTDSTAAS